MAVINGNDNPNSLTGTTGADQINGLGGDDAINASTRPTVVGSGIDVVDGGTGIDTLVVNASAETQDVQLSTGDTPSYEVRSTSGNFFIDAYNMEAVNFVGGSGNDSIDTGQLGGRVNGGSGSDRWLANLGGLFTNVTFTLGTTASIADAGMISILNIEAITLSTGSGNDTITGGAQADSINTGDGDDIIDARTRPTAPGSGIDVVDGGLDTDTLVVNAAAETQAVSLQVGSSPSFAVRSTSGNFFVDAYNMEKVKFTGGSGGDSIDTGDRGGTVNGGGGIDRWLADLSALTVAVGFTLGTTAAVAAAGLTSILNIEALTLSTGSGNDVITGGAQADSINTGAGNDTINVKTRPTAPGSGIDVADGGLGTDTLVVDASAETLAVQLSVGSSPSFAVRSNSGNFFIDAYNVEIVKFAGGAGADTIATGNRGGTVSGGGGIDHWTADLSALNAAVAFTLGTTTAIAAAGLTSILGIERLSLTTGAGNDTIVGGNQADTIGTGIGNDTIDAKTRPIVAGSGIDVVDGGAGIDTLVVNAAAETKAVQLSVGSSPSFAVRSSSGNFFVDAYNVEMVKFTGGAGADTIDTGNRAGTVNGGGGIDHWSADLGALLPAVAFTLGTTTAIAAAGLTSILNVERLSLVTGAGADSIVGGSQADTISTGNGNDTIDAKTRPAAPGSAIDVVNGGNGLDTLIVNAAAETQAVQLGAGSSPSFTVRSTSGNFFVDAYRMEVVKFTSGSGNDIASGGAYADVLSTGGGLDALDGGLGDDTLNAGLGNDMLTGGRGIDHLTGGGGSDVFDYNLAVESLAPSGKVDTIADFEVGIDDINLFDIDANNLGADGNQAFIFIAGGAFTGVRGQLRSVAGAVEGDVNGDTVADFRILLGNGATAGAGDLIL